MNVSSIVGMGILKWIKYPQKKNLPIVKRMFIHRQTYCAYWEYFKCTSCVGLVVLYTQDTLKVHSIGTVSLTLDVHLFDDSEIIVFG